jgi:hypothetical protein
MRCQSAGRQGRLRVCDVARELGAVFLQLHNNGCDFATFCTGTSMKRLKLVVDSTATRSLNRDSGFAQFLRAIQDRGRRGCARVIRLWTEANLVAY